MTHKGKRFHVFLDSKVYDLLEEVSRRTGKSKSAIIRESILSHFGLNEVSESLNEMKRVAEKFLLQSRKTEEVMEEVSLNLKALVQEFTELKKAIEVSIFFSALTSEMLKARLFNVKPLSDSEFEKYRTLWELACQKADERVNALTGKRVWKGKFNPQK